MSAAQPAQRWHQENQRDLGEQFNRVRASLERYLANQKAAPVPAVLPQKPTTGETTGAKNDPLYATSAICMAFGLTGFERDLLLLCAGVGLEAAFAGLVAQCQQGLQSVQPGAPTFALALAALPDAHWSAILPESPLRRWRLIEPGPGDSLVLRPLHISERVLHHLAGINSLDESLQSMVEFAPPPLELPLSQTALTNRIIQNWNANRETGENCLVQITGAATHDLRPAAAYLCARINLNLYALPAASLPTQPDERELLARIWEREAALSGSVLLVECDDYTTPEQQRSAADWTGRIQSRVIIAAQEPLPVSNHRVLRYDLPHLLPVEQREIWQTALGQLNGHATPLVDRLVSQFNLSAIEIQTAMQESRFGQSITGLPDPDELWEACRRQARPRVENLAQRIDSNMEWDDLILPPPQLQILHSIAAHVRNRAKVYETWGFGARSQRGLGISALFSGPSGTGKTLAAEVLARELHLDLYRVDLSALVSKYIGETEKNLRRVFDAAEGGGAILLFDEADALFGKRSEVQDSHDRYANIEVSYLLQRMEAYRGLAILTTNLKSALDSAFLRRIRFIVQFPFPDIDQRRLIWMKIFPSSTPLAELDYGKLARLSVAGGSIRNIALNAAFIAADEDQPVDMNHLLRAAQAEYGKLEKNLTETEVRGWG